MRMRLNRRNFVSLAGLGLGGLGLGAAAPWSRSRASVLAPPRRVVFVYAEGGWTAPHLVMRPPGAPAEWSEYNIYDAERFGTVPDPLEFEFSLTDSSLTEDRFSRVLAPLYRHRSKMTVFEGLAMLSTSLDPNGDAHAQGHIGCMSAIPAAYTYDEVKSWGSGPSMDQRIQEFLRNEAPELRSLDFRPSVDRQYVELFHEFLYRSDGMGGAERLPTQSDPEAAFDDLFGGSEVPPTDPLELAQQQILAVTDEQFRDLSGRLAGDDRVKIETHREMLEALRTRLGSQVDCGSPARPGSIDGVDEAEGYVQDFDSFTQLIGAAFACGVSRVASLGLTMIPPQLYGLPSSASIHHEYEHESDPFVGFASNSPFEGVYSTQSETWINAYEGMVARNVWQAQQVAKLADILDAIPEGDGTLLDSTLIVYLSELSSGVHGHEAYPVILLGAGGGIVTPGRYIKYAQSNPNPYGRNYANEFTGTPHTHLFISILQAFGMDVDMLGAASVEGAAPHANVEGIVNLSGPLPRLVV